MSVEVVYLEVHLSLFSLVLKCGLHGVCRYFMQAVRLAMKDDQVRTGLVVVNHMLESPAALFQPLIALKVFSLALQDAFAHLGNRLRGREVQRA